VGRAPQGLGGEVEVAAEQEVQLTGPKHEVKGQVGGGGEILVDGGEEREICRVIPLLPWCRGRAAVVATGNGVADRKVAGWDEVKLVSQVEGRDGGPDAAGANGGGIVSKGLLNMPGKGMTRLGAMTGQDTKGTCIGGEGCGLQGLEGEAEPPFGGVAQAAGRLQESVCGGMGGS
jgi:hypothetical protein